MGDKALALELPAVEETDALAIQYLGGKGKGCGGGNCLPEVLVLEPSSFHLPTWVGKGRIAVCQRTGHLIWTRSY